MLIDLTGNELVSGNLGKDCPANGSSGNECCCDECDYMLCCLDTHNEAECEDCNEWDCPRKIK
ncbi:MAG: hypothetical protein KIG65_09010 [Eubacteriales bacterium]|nr:hypothetical protein [Eubacteriales bacterium]